MNLRNTAPTCLLAAIAGFAVATAPTKAAEISTSTTAPSVDALDVSNLAAGTATQKWFDDIEHDAGQTFTPTSDGLLNSFTIHLSSGNPNDAGDENVDVRFGTISRPGGVFTFTDVHVENAAMAASPGGDWAAGDYVTFTFDTPQPVTAGVEYGIITDARKMGGWRDGIPYRHRTGNLYAGGSLINRGGESAGSDLVFHANITAGSDTIPPVISGLNPGNTDTGVLPVSDLVITFNETVKAGSGHIVIRQSGGTEVETTDVSSGSVTINGTTVTINPTADFGSSTTFYVEIDNGAIEDSVGNPFPGFTGDTTWSFSTGAPDVTSPSIASLDPTNTEADVAVNADLAISFDEDVRKGTGDIVIKELASGTVVETISVDSGSVTISGPAVTINPVNNLAFNTVFYVEIASGAIEDLSGNDFTGITGDTTWSFTTLAAPLNGYISVSTTAPIVDGYDIANLVAGTGSLKWFDDVEHDAGQTFTPTKDAQMTSFTIRLAGSNQDDGGEAVNLRLGTISRPDGVFTFTDIYSEEISLDGDWNAGDYVTFSFATPQALTAGVEYGIITDAQAMGAYQVGIPYIATSGNSYADGNAIGRGGQRNDDLVFHVDIEHPMSPSPHGVTIAGGSVPLTWTNFPPTTGTDVWVDVWFGSEPGMLTKVVDAALNTTTTSVTAPVADTYYWRVNSYLNGSASGTPVESDLFEFYIDDTDGDGFPDEYELANTNPPSNLDLNRTDDLENDGAGDGLTAWEEYRLGTDPLEADSDGDNLDDGPEVHGAGTRPATDPLKPDTDDDGLNDDIETNTGNWVSSSDTGTDPTDPDYDNDGLVDGVESKSGTFVGRTTDTGTDPYLADTDRDGAGDWYEVTATFTDPNDNTEAPSVPYPLPDPVSSDTGVTTKPVKVYIMSGQSNMVGIGYIDGTAPGSMETVTMRDGKFPNMVDGAAYTQRNDVLYRGVVTAIGDGPLKVGVQGNRIGPEQGFGHVMGWYHDEPVLLIKSSQGNRGLAWDFMPPGSPSYTVDGITYAGYGDQDKQWSDGDPYDASSESGWYAGKQFDDCFLDEADWHANGAAFESITNVADVLDDFATHYPDWAAQGYEIAGFVWWQGHWDGGEQGTGPANVYANRYEGNLVNMIDSLRTEFNAPNAPFVVATVGFGGGGWDIGSSGDVIFKAQMAVGDPAQHPRYARTVASVDTTGYWRELSESPGGQGFHYNNNAETYTLVGDAMGRAMIDLLENGTTPSDYDTWIGEYPGADLSNLAADYDGDGLTNDEERIWGLDPTSPASATPISMPLDQASGTLTYTRRKPGLTGLTYTYEWSTTLEGGSWTPVVPAGMDDIVPSGNNETVTVDLTGAPGNPLAHPALFVRVVAAP